MEIIPAIMPETFKDLLHDMSLVEGVVPLVQVDVMDGHYVPDATWPYNERNDVEFDSIIQEEKGFPLWKKIDYEADLMIKNPENRYYDWILAGAKRVIVHADSVTDLRSLIKDFKSRVPSKDSLLHTELGLAVGIETKISDIEFAIPEVDFIQCMGIARIGRQGEPFDERVLSTISYLRKKYPDLIISVDGGVGFETAPQLLEAGADRLVSGSAIFGSNNIREAIEHFKELDNT